MAPMKKQQKKDTKKKAKTFQELKALKSKQILKRIQKRDIEAIQREELKKLKEKKAEEEAKAILLAKSLKEKEQEAIKNFRKEIPFLSQADFAKEVKKEYGIDIGLEEPLSKIELKDAQRALSKQKRFRRIISRKTEEELQQQEREKARKEEEEKQKTLLGLRRAEEESKKQKEAEQLRLSVLRAEKERELATRRERLAKQQQEEESRIMKRIREEAPQQREIQKRREVEMMQQREQKQRGKLIKEINKELDRYAKEQSKLQANLEVESKRYEKANRSFEKRIGKKPEEEWSLQDQNEAEKLSNRAMELGALRGKNERLMRVLDVLKQNKRVVEGNTPLDKLQQLEEDDAKKLGLSRIGERVVAVREAKKREQEEEEEMPELIPAQEALAQEPEEEQVNLLANAIAQPPAEAIVLPADANANNANELENAPPEVVADINAERASGLVRNYAIHPSHIKETKNSYKLTGKGMKHAKMLFKHLPNHAEKLLAFSLLNKARNKLHKLDKKKKIRGGVLDDLTNALENDVMNYAGKTFSNFVNTTANTLSNTIGNLPGMEYLKNI